MITLHLGIGKGDIRRIELECGESLVRYIEQNLPLNEPIVWVACSDTPDTEIIITEDLDVITFSIEYNMWDFDNNNFHLQEYRSYEDAYKVALDMRETNPLCYN